VFAVVVVHEPVLRFGLAAHAVVTEFAAGLPGLAVRADLKIHRLQLIEIEELERLEPYLRDHDFTLAECLRAKVHDDPDHRMGFWQFVTTSYLPAHVSRQNQTQGWPGFLAGWRKRLHGGSIAVTISIQLLTNLDRCLLLLRGGGYVSSCVQLLEYLRQA
jgi:hypothetical protein